MTDEEKTPENKKQAETASGNDFGKHTSGEGLIERAKKEREILVLENERMEKNIRELRELEASRLLGSTAGIRTDETPKIQTSKEYAEDVMSGKVKLE